MLVKIINEYTDRALFKLFSREKTVKEFLQKINPDHLEKFIRPYVEKRLLKCFTISRDENIPVYYQKTKTATLHSEDLLLVSEEKAEPIFRFDKNEEQTTYSLSLESDGKEVHLRNSSVDIICINPCLIREDHNIFFVSDIEGSKLRPFLAKENILIPKKTELKYFRGFVLNTINNFKVEYSGFKIIEVTPEKEAVLVLETGLKGDSRSYLNLQL